MKRKVLLVLVAVLCFQPFGGCVAFVKDRPCPPCGEIPRELTENRHMSPLPEPDRKAELEHKRADFFFHGVGRAVRAIGHSVDYLTEQFRRVRMVPLGVSDVKSVHIVVDMEVAMK